jgi:glycosyltransferase 2 family protein
MLSFDKGVVQTSLLNKKTVLISVKIIIAALLIALIVKQVHWHDYSIIDDNGQKIISKGVLSSVKGANLYLLACSVLCLIVTQFIAGYRWQQLLRIQQIRVRFKNIINLTFLSSFLCLTLPGLFGGDLIKAYLVARHTPRKAHVLVSIFFDRLFGLAGFTIMATVMLFIVWATGVLNQEAIYTPALTVAVVVGGITIGIPLLLSSRLRKFLYLNKIFERLPFYRYIAQTSDAIDIYRRKWRNLSSMIGITLVCHIVAIFSVILVGMSLGLSMEWYLYFLYVPLVTIISAVPLSPGSVGLTEKLYLLYMASAGNSSEVLALAVLVRITIVLSNVPGITVAVLGHKMSRADVLQAKLEMENA